MQKNFGFVLGLILIPIAILAVAGVTIVELRQYFDQKSLDQTSLINQDLEKINVIVSNFEDLSNKLEDYAKYGVEVEEFATRSAQIGGYIRDREFDLALSTIDQIASASGKLYEEKIEEIKLTVLADLKKLDFKIADYKTKGVNVTSIEDEYAKIKELIDKGDYLAARDLIASVNKSLDTLLAAKL
ncbi:MAG TPA: hypothetical protein VIK81_00805, partial [Patescibacteria group bacterium]